jgi:DNA-binding winged helix-turn-helix (wHTH) protein
MRHRIGEYELDENLFEVTHRGARLAAPPKVFDTLLLLARNLDRVVTKNELIRVVWEGAQVTEDALSQTIRRARLLLGFSGPSGPCIQTVRGRGYRLLVNGGEDCNSVASGADATSVALGKMSASHQGNFSSKEEPTL